MQWVWFGSIRRRAELKLSSETWCHANIIQKRYNELAKEWEYYVHYENSNRRLDEWVMRNRMMSTYDGLETMIYWCFCLHIRPEP